MDIPPSHRSVENLDTKIIYIDFKTQRSVRTTVRRTGTVLHSALFRDILRAVNSDSPDIGTYFYWMKNCEIFFKF